MGHIKRGHLRQALVAVPPSEFLGRCDEVLSPLCKIFATTQLESRKLAEIRDCLLSEPPDRRGARGGHSWLRPPQHKRASRWSAPAR